MAKKWTFVVWLPTKVRLGVFKQWFNIGCREVLGGKDDIGNPYQADPPSVHTDCKMASFLTTSLLLSVVKISCRSCFMKFDSCSKVWVQCSFPIFAFWLSIWIQCLECRKTQHMNHFANETILFAHKFWPHFLYSWLIYMAPQFCKKSQIMKI